MSDFQQHESNDRRDLILGIGFLCMVLWAWLIRDALREIRDRLPEPAIENKQIESGSAEEGKA